MLHPENVHCDHQSVGISASVPAEPIPRFGIGQTVFLQDLVSPEGVVLNGCSGSVVAISQMDSMGQIRYRVNVEGRFAVIREKNLEGDRSKCANMETDSNETVETGLSNENDRLSYEAPPSRCVVS